jgi:hypothetical protein
LSQLEKIRASDPLGKIFEQMGLNRPKKQRTFVTSLIHSIIPATALERPRAAGDFVPYQTYLYLDDYAFLNQRPNLAADLAANGFETRFISSFASHHRRFIPYHAAWTSMELIERIEDYPGYIAVQTNPVESACEDLAVLDRIVAALAHTARDEFQRYLDWFTALRQSTPEP